LRRGISGQAVVSRTGAEAAGRIDPFGRTLKHLYSKDSGWASPDESKRW